MTTNNIMAQNIQQELGKTLWAIANNLRGAMMADDFRDYMLSFLFWKYLSDNYIKSAQKELGSDYARCKSGTTTTPTIPSCSRNR